MSSGKYALLVDSAWCTGCHTCETACQMEHGLPVGQYGIKVSEVGPWEYESDGKRKWQYAYLPSPTDQCDTCAHRRANGKRPTCVHHCQAKCLEFGTAEEMQQKLGEMSKGVLFML